MEYEMKQVEKRMIAGSRMVGPWGRMVKQGFEQLVIWVNGKQVVPLKQITAYYNSPDVVPTERLHCGIVVSVPEGFEILENSERVIQTELTGGDYAITVTCIENHGSTAPWRQFSGRLLQDPTYAIAAKPYFRIYMNNGMEGDY